MTTKLNSILICLAQSLSYWPMIQMSEVVSLTHRTLILTSNPTMVSRPPADRKTLAIQNAESATAPHAFVAKYGAENKEDKINNDGVLVDWLVTNLFLSRCGQHAINKISSLMSSRSLIDTSYKDIRWAIQNLVSPKGSSSDWKN